jgi:choline dehydrogenase-like flavoprotein
MLPNPNNRIARHAARRDNWDMPIAVIDCAKAMLVATGATNIQSSEDSPMTITNPGSRIHEMGTAGMGADPTRSVLKGWCQPHDVANLFVTDDVCMPPSGCQNPSLTYMALSARSANYAADLLRDGKL